VRRRVNLKDCGLVRDEAVAYSILLARANGLYNGRRVLAFEPLRRSGKACEWNLAYEERPLASIAMERRCGKPAAVRLLCAYGEEWFAVYLCAEHFRRIFDNVLRKVEMDLRRMLKCAEEAMRE
jgi:hypothetical protein